MNFITRITLPLLAIGALMFVGCAKKEPEAPATTTTDSTEADLNAAIEDVEVPTQEEADKEAAETINEDNADEIFNELQEELDRESDDG